MIDEYKIVIIDTDDGSETIMKVTSSSFEEIQELVEDLNRKAPDGMLYQLGEVE